MDIRTYFKKYWSKKYWSKRHCPRYCKKYWSTFRDGKSPNRRAMEQGAMSTTAIGLVAGLAITALLVVVREIVNPGPLWTPTFWLSIAVAALFTTSAIGRATTHFAKGVNYDAHQLLLDLGIVVSGVALVGLLSRNSYGPDFPMWFWLGILLLFLNLRNRHLSSRYRVEGLRLGMIVGAAVLLIVTVIAFFFSASQEIMLGVGVAGLVLVIGQFCLVKSRFVCESI